jgi:hypothetical protein
MSTVEKNQYVVIGDRKIFLPIDRVLSVIEVYIQDKSTSLILVKVKDNQYSYINRKFFIITFKVFISFVNIINSKNKDHSTIIIQNRDN